MTELPFKIRKVAAAAQLVIDTQAAAAKILASELPGYMKAMQLEQLACIAEAQMMAIRSAREEDLK